MAKWLAERERQGWSWAELSRRTAVPVWTLRWWARRGRKAATRRESRGGFVAVAVREPARAEAAPIEVVSPTGWCVRVPADIDPEQLRRVLGALAPPC